MSSTYYPIQRKWRQLRAVFERPAVLELMHEEMECYAKARAEDRDHAQRISAGDGMDNTRSIGIVIAQFLNHPAAIMPTPGRINDPPDRPDHYCVQPQS